MPLPDGDRYCILTFLFTCNAAVSCAERGLKSHLLLRGEQPSTLTGYNLISTLYGNVSYVPRSLYARREEMLLKHAHIVAGNDGLVFSLSDLEASLFSHGCGEHSSHVDSLTKRSKKIAIINEGAGDAAALLGNNCCVCCGDS